MKHIAARAQRLGNGMLKEIDLGSKIREWVNSALFGMGILKVGWEQTNIMDYQTEMGETFWTVKIGSFINRWTGV